MKEKTALYNLVFYIFGFFIFVLVCTLMNFASFEGAPRYKILSDAAALPAVLLLSLGVVRSISGDVLDIFVYAISHLFGNFFHRKNVNYADFKKERQERKRAPIYHAYIAGCVFLVFSVAFTVIFYTA